MSSMNYDLEYVLQHYRQPSNYGSLENPDLHCEGINTLCGDWLTIDMQVRDQRVVAIRFQGKGCALSQAGASILSEMIEGMALQEVAALDKDDLLTALGISVGPARMKCALLPLEVLQQGLERYAQHEGDEERRS